jgi:DNA-directed RNA polymerase subunit RPC12/RpoP
MSEPADDDAPGIRCPRCGCRDLRRAYTRQVPGAARRARDCRHCGKRVITLERVSGGRKIEAELPPR